MRCYRLGSNAKTGLKVHSIWIPRYRKTVLKEQVAIRNRDILRQIAYEHELKIVSGKVAIDHAHIFVSHRLTQYVSKIVQ